MIDNKDPRDTYPALIALAFSKASPIFAANMIVDAELILLRSSGRQVFGAHFAGLGTKPVHFRLVILAFPKIRPHGASRMQVLAFTTRR
jgi:hypothetical protein